MSTVRDENTNSFRAARELLVDVGAFSKKRGPQKSCRVFKENEFATPPRSKKLRSRADCPLARPVPPLTLLRNANRCISSSDVVDDFCPVLKPKEQKQKQQKETKSFPSTASSFSSLMMLTSPTQNNSTATLDQCICEDAFDVPRAASLAPRNEQGVPAPPSSHAEEAEENQTSSISSSAAPVAEENKTPSLSSSAAPAAPPLEHDVPVPACVAGEQQQKEKKEEEKNEVKDTDEANGDFCDDGSIIIDSDHQTPARKSSAAAFFTGFSPVKQSLSGGWTSPIAAAAHASTFGLQHGSFLIVSPPAALKKRSESPEL